MTNKVWETRYRNMMQNGNGLFQKIPKAKKEFFKKHNPEISVERLSWSSRVIIKWVCSVCAHKWSASPNNRFKNAEYRPCPECSRKIAAQKKRRTTAKKRGSIADGMESVFKEWNWEKNTGIDPKKIAISSTDKFWWRCVKCKKSYRATAARRFVEGTGCRDCSFAEMGNRYRKKAALENPFLKSFPDLEADWDFEKNTEPPDHFSVSSNKNAHWKCKFGHSYKKVIAERTGRGGGCPICQVHGTSRNELRIYCELKAKFPDVLWRNSQFGIEIDIYIPELAVGIEYDGSYWHKGKELQDKKKSRLLKERNILLYRLRETGLPLITELCISVPAEPITILTFQSLIGKIKENASSNKATLQKLIDMVDFEAGNEFQTLLSRLPAPPLQESFSQKCPDKIKYWDYKENFPLTPDLFYPRATYQAHWLCPDCGSKFQKSLDRVFQNKFVCVRCAVVKTRQSRISNNAQNKSALDVKPRLRQFISDKEALKVEELGPGSHQRIETKCPSCKTQKTQSIKSMTKNKFLCRPCGIY